jgi:CBS domain-containing protein
MTNTIPTPSLDDALARRTVRDAMQLGLFECAPDAGLPAVASTMADKAIHCVVVAGIERRDRFGERLAWGIVSDLDLMRGLTSGPDRLTAGELAATDIVAVDPADTLQHAAQLMAEHDTAHLVVASPQTGRPVGMISTLDIANALVAQSGS